MGQDKLDREKIKSIIAEELEDLIQGDVSIEGINVDMKGGKVEVTFGLHIVEADNYIGLNIY